MTAVGMRKRAWFKAAGVVTFAAQLLGGAGLASAQSKTCMPQPTFVSGGDPDPKSLTVDNTTKWTGGSGYGWNDGSVSEVAYEIALANNLDANAGTNEIDKKWVLLSFMSQRPMPQITGTGGIRIGFDYPYKKGLLDETVSQIITMNWDAGILGQTWNTKPPACPTGAPICANDPAKDPATWTSFTPPKIAVLQKLTPTGSAIDAETTGWGTDTSWIKNHSWAWFWKTSDGKYYWRINVALPVRTTLNDPSVVDPVPWKSPSIYLDPTTFTAAGKTFPGFWAEMITDATDGTPKVINHFPDWPVGTAEGRDNSNIPKKGLWGQAEAGSPRALSLQQPGELSCSGTGLLIEGTAGDNVLWHSAIWNSYDPTLMGVPITNSSSLWDPAGTLYMYDVTHTRPAHNNMSVLLDNQGGGRACSSNADCGAAPAKCDLPPLPAPQTGYCEVDPANVRAQFLVAPYGSQAVGTVWSPLNTGNNDYTCKSGTGGATCTPQPVLFPPIDSVPHSSTMIPQGATANRWDMAQDWIPHPNYVCAVQTDDNPGSFKWWYKTLGTGPNDFCDMTKRVYQPTDMTGTAGSPPGVGAGLPGHQCMQVSLSGNGVQLATKSAFRNMHQAPASLYREVATIDTRGLPKIPGQTYHYIYLYLETSNMPYRVDAGYAPKTGSDTQAVYTAINKECSQPPQCNGCMSDGVCFPGTTDNECGLGGGQCLSCGQDQYCADNGTCQFPISLQNNPVVSSRVVSSSTVSSRAVARPAPIRTSATAKALRLSPYCNGFDPNVPAPSEEFITKIMPTMIVHAYADTGVTEKINGQTVPILTPMTSFGQYIHHDSTTEGNVFGWDANLEPFGNTQFQKVGVDTYRIRIPNDGAGQVVTHVEPLPTKRPTCTGTVNPDIVTLLKAIAPLITISSEDAGEINALINSFDIQCVDLQEILNKIDAGKWGSWQSWIHYLIVQVEATDGCHCN